MSNLKFVVLAAVGVGVLVTTLPANAAWVEYYDRAAWTAALGGSVVVEGVDTVASDIALGTTTIGTLTYTSPGGQPDATGGTTLAVSGYVDGSPGINWSGTTGSVRYTRVDLPGTHNGVGFDYRAQSPSNDSDGRPHNSLYMLVSGNSGEWPGTFAGIGHLVNDSDESRPLTGFYGVIDDQGGITSFQVGSYWTNFQSFGADNFSYDVEGAGGAQQSTPEPSTLVLAALGLLPLGMLRRRKRG